MREQMSMPFALVDVKEFCRGMKVQERCTKGEE